MASLRKNNIWHDRWNKIKNGFRYAFAIEHKTLELNNDDEKLMITISYEIRKRKLAVPAMLFLETFRPLQAMGPYVIQFAYPFASLFVNPKYVDQLTDLFEKPKSVLRLLDILEMQDKDFDGLRDRFQVGPEYKALKMLIGGKNAPDLKAPSDAKSPAHTELPPDQPPDKANTLD